jgi:hypothetical protein
MAHHIERAKSGRAACKGCQEMIARGELRLAEEVPNAFSGHPGNRYYHLPCAADARPGVLREALAAYTDDVPHRNWLLQRIERALGELPPVEFPFAERGEAPAGCAHCGLEIFPGDLRLAVERREDAGAYVRLGAAFLHPHCARAFGLGEHDAALLRTHSRGVSPVDLDALDAALAPPDAQPSP